MPTVTEVTKLKWPSELAESFLECGGAKFVEYEAERRGLATKADESAAGADPAAGLGGTDATKEPASSKPAIDLLELSSEQLEKLTYYQVLGNLPLHASAEQIKKAYHKACLKYHPDKTGRGEEDEVFLKVKAAFDTLSDVGNGSKRKAYDSSLPFDESIPKGNEPASEFYKVYEPVFQRNLRFDARLDPQSNASPSPGKSNNNNKKKKKNAKRKNNNNNGNNNSNGNSKTFVPPSFGDDDTPIDKVHEFYEYWIHFESWRDFSMQAAKLTNNENFDADNVDSRYEKRFIQKEIEKKAKALKRDEMVRINTLVERAMAADPRLLREKQRLQEEKERTLRERKAKEEAEQLAKQQEEERIAKETAEREQQEKDRKAAAKAQKEKEKKQLRKARQGFRKLMLATHSSSSSILERWESMEDMNDDVEFLCQNLKAAQLEELTESLGGPQTEAPTLDGLLMVQEKLLLIKEGRSQEEAEAELQKRRARQEEKLKAEAAKATKLAAKQTWSKEELSALAKAVKKYPPGGANRWDTITMFVNNQCQPDTPKTKEDCITKYNQVAKMKPGTEQNENANGAEGAKNADSATEWTEEQIKQLQEALAKYPASMEKNERWSSIAKGVEGKSKKECVEQFKKIREALKNKK